MQTCKFCATRNRVEGMWEIACLTDGKTICVCCGCMTAENLQEWLGDKYASELAGGL